MRGTKAALEEEAAEIKRDRKALEKVVAGSRKSLAVKLGERRKLVNLRVMQGSKLDELEQAGMTVSNLKKEVKGLTRDLREAKDISVAVLKLFHQKELQDMMCKAKSVEINLAVQWIMVATLEGSLKLAENEASKARGKLDELAFHNAKSDQVIQTIQQKQTLR